MAIQRITSGIIADGAIVATDIGDGIVTNDKLAGSITSDKITSVSNTAISGLIQAAQIGSANASVIDAGTLAGARLPTGSVLQVVSVTYSTQTSITSTSYVDSGITTSITPTSASSKVLVIIQLSGRYYTQTNAARSFLTNIVRASTQIHEISATDIQSGTGTNGFAQYPVLSSLVYLDSPATTASTTYKVQAKVSDTASSTTAQFNDGGGVSTITLMEIAA
jgi:hypothetical protein